MVMAGFIPAIHVFQHRRSSWMPGACLREAKLASAKAGKPGHDEAR
jgi:hypothetical protein